MQRENNGLYECIAVYVDDLLIAATDSNSIVQKLQEKHKFKLKGVVHLPTILDVITFTTWTVPYVMDQGIILIISWDSMRTFLVANHVNIYHL
jgi:hypothetical protein